MRSSTPPASVGPAFGPSDRPAAPESGSRRAGSARKAGPASRSSGHRPVQSISSLPTSSRADQDRRLRNYLISMGIRTLCFVLAGIFAMATDWTVAVWICVVAAAILPYPAVVFANNIDRRQSPMTTVSPTRAIEASSARAILGSVVSDDEKPDDNEPDDEQSDDDSAPSAPRTDRPS